MTDRDAPDTIPSEAREGERVSLPPQPEGRYEVAPGTTNPELARGGMGRVLALVDTHLQREVAVKELLAHHTAERSSSGPLLENLFVREARVLARLEHPGVVPVYELGRRHDGTPYYAMRRIRGRTLAAALDACASLDERLALLPHLLDVVQTLGYAHSRRVVHRDLKPENVMVGRFGETQVIDWGLAVVDDEAPEGGVLAGTPAYMAPEQASGRSVDARSDVWALGVMLYELLAGRLPWGVHEATALLHAVQHAPLPPLTDFVSGVPPALEAVLRRALERDPARRFPDAGAMADALEAAQRARAARPIGWWLVVVALGLLASSLGAVALRQSQRADAAARDAHLAVGDARRDAAGARASAALAALRARDTFSAAALAAQVPEHPLGRGVGLVARSRGVPARAWSVKTPAGCSALAAVDGAVACATLNGVTLYGPDGKVRAELSTGPRGWQHAVVALDEVRLAAAGDDRQLRVFDVRTTKEAQPARELPAAVLALAVQGEALIAGLVTGEVLRVAPDGALEPLTAHPRPLRALAASAASIASASESLLRLSGAARVELDRPVGAVTFLSDTRLVLGVERALALLDGSDARWLAQGHRDDVAALAVTRAGDAARILSGGGDGTVRWWREDGAAEGTLEGFAPGVQALAALPGGLVVVATRDRRLEAWALPPPVARPALDGVPSAWAFWPDAGLVVGLRDGRLLRLDDAGADARQLEARHRGPVRALAPNRAPPRPEAVRFVSGGDDGQVLAQRWNGEVEPLDALSGARVTAIAVAPDGARAAWVADDGTRVLWSLEFSREIHRERDTRAEALAFAPDGRRLALAREDKHVTLHDAETGGELARLGPLDGAATALAWTPDGLHLAAGAADGVTTLWDVAAGKPVARLRGPAVRVASLAVNHDGTALAVGSDDGAAWLFALPTGELLAQLPFDAGDVRLVAFTPRGLLAAGRDGLVHRALAAP